MNLLIMQFPPISRHFISLRPNIPLSTLFSNLNVRDQVSHTYRTKGNVIVWYILTFTFLDSRREGKSFCAEW
jgi:hypothetical protein